MKGLDIGSHDRVMPSRRYWLLLGLGVFGLKVLFYFLDPNPGFFLGDSASYIFSAVSGWVPPDRSYVYGYFIRFASLGNQSLDALVITQVVLSGITCMILAFILLRFARVAAVFAALAALLCAVEPTQLLEERFAMAEASSLFVFALFLLSVLYYAGHRRLWLLPLSAAIGVLAVSLRTEYLPVTLGLGLLAVLAGGWWRSGDGSVLGRRLIRMAVHLAVHLTLYSAVFFGLLALEESRRVNTDSGFFLAMAWSPLLADQSLPRDDRLNAIIAANQCGLGWDSRSRNMWSPNCLKSQIHQQFPDYHQANDYARGLAGAVLWHQPMGVLGLGFKTWQALWSEAPSLRALQSERGVRKVPDDFINLVKTNYGLDVTGWDSRETLVGNYFESMGDWYRWVALSPLLLLLWWLLTWRRLHPYSLLLSATAMMLLISVTLPVVIVMVRFYHPIAWLSFFGLAGMMDWLWRLRALFGKGEVLVDGEVDTNNQPDG